MNTQFELGAKRRRSPFTAAILGLLTPGLGLLYCGKIRPAFFALTGAILPWLICALSANAALKTSMVLLYFVLYAAQLIWGVIVAWRIGENYELQRFNRGLVYILVFMLFAAYNELDSSYLTQIAPLSTSSMSPALGPEDVVLISRAAYRLGDPKVGDVVAYLHDPRSQAPFLGRIIATPGATVELINGNYKVDGEQTEIPSGINTDGKPTMAASLNELSLLTLQGEQYFIAADNQSAGYDSRLCGTVARDQLVGRIDAVLLSGSHGSARWGEKP